MRPVSLLPPVLDDGIYNQEIQSKNIITKVELQQYKQGIYKQLNCSGTRSVVEKIYHIITSPQIF